MMHKLLIMLACFLVVLVVSLILTSHYGRRYLESFVSSDNTLLDPQRTVVVQGTQVPNVFKSSDATYTSDMNLPSVNGKANGPRSMAMMTFNKCKPECCPSSYSCSGGCVCQTSEQSDLLSMRGGNKTVQKT